MVLGLTEVDLTSFDLLIRQRNIINVSSSGSRRMAQYGSTTLQFQKQTDSDSRCQFVA